MNDKHPAVIANEQSIQLASSKQKDQWLALYSDDALLCDPVGVSPLDPSGQGHQGKAAIEQFWDNVIGASSINITVNKRCISGSHSCAVYQTAENDLGGGIKTHIDMMAIYTVNDAGLITHMQAYWDWEDMQQQLQKLGLA